MKYFQPAKAPEDAPYVDGNRSAGERGSVVPAKAIEAPQREIVHVIEQAGLTPSATDFTQLHQAIQILLEAVTGEGDVEGFVKLVQASSRMLFYPEVQSSTGHFGVISPSAGLVRVPAGVNFLHRGIAPYTTVETDLTTEANKTYHLRWNKTDGFTLKDLASGTYNPAASPETDRKFDSVFDDMLVARVVTNGSDVATIVNLVNRDRMAMSGETEIVDNNPYENDKKPSQIAAGTSVSINWARTPRAALSGMTDVDGSAAGALEFNLGIRVVSRYQARTYYQFNGPNAVGAAFSYEVWA